MKRLLYTFVFVTILLSGGCKNTSLFSTVVTITEIRDSVMTELAKAYKAGLIDQSLDKKIGEADEKYRKACESLEIALVLYKETNNSDNYVQQILAVKQALFSVIDLLAPFTTKETEFTQQLAKATKL